MGPVDAMTWGRPEAVDPVDLWPDGRYRIDTKYLEGAVTNDQGCQYAVIEKYGDALS
jgi:hypothetical protein